MNWEFIIKYLPTYERAAWLTLRIGVAGIVAAIVLGLVCATVQYYRVPVLRQIVAFYIELSRNTPLLVQLFFIYYGLPKVGISTNAEVCGVAGLAFLGGSYMAETFRSGLESVDAIQSESAYSLGHERRTGDALRDPAPGHLRERTALRGKRDLPSEGDQRIQRHQPDGSDVYGQRPDRSVLPDDREPVPAGGLLSSDLTAGFSAGKPAGKEAASCRIWGLRYYSKART